VLLELVTDKRPWNADYDLISGLVGFAVYILERLPNAHARSCLEEIVACLAELAQHTPDGITWLTTPAILPDWQRAECPQGHYNLGLAHGIPGIVAVLARIRKAGIAAEQAGVLLEGAVRWLLAQRLPSGLGVSFPMWVGPSIAPVQARTAWCYGDLGVAVALLHAAHQAGDASWERAACDIAR
jgi:hypothetical protein